jgi:hypothetical protein
MLSEAAIVRLSQKSPFKADKTGNSRILQRAGSEKTTPGVGSELISPMDGRVP